MSKSPFPKCVLVDANFLVMLVSNDVSDDDRARIDHFLFNAEKSKARIVVPMPAVAEYLVGANTAAIESFNKLERKAHIFVAPFDRAAAFECALLDRAALGAGNKKDEVAAPWQKIKVDRQIIAIGKAQGATIVISRDDGVRKNALRVGISAMTVSELELPASAKQARLNLVITDSARATGPN
ncbi:PIN domain-containing protein [Caballeronia glebae]|uniref:PIN domain-containing protein n=1 Tax=Caballeronia glebae TaxID=1777143 RepID=UPI0038BD247D